MRVPIFDQLAQTPNPFVGGVLVELDLAIGDDDALLLYF